MSFDSPAGVTEALAGQRYLADRGLSTAVYLAATLEQPLLLEGEAGVGKTEVAKALAGATGARLIRLQCHEGIDRLRQSLGRSGLPNAGLALEQERLLELRGEEHGRRERAVGQVVLPREGLLDRLDRCERRRSRAQAPAAVRRARPVSTWARWRL